jgi:DNA repair protein RadC
MNNNMNLSVESSTDLKGQGLTTEQARIVQQALTLLHSSMQKRSVFFGGSKDARNYLTLKLANRPNEVFVCLYLDSQHYLIEYKEHFFGTIDRGSVCPRIVVQTAMSNNACAVIVAHNHPSGKAEPSQSDRDITQRLVAACHLVDVRLLDHLVVGAESIVSFSERGLLSNA